MEINVDKSLDEFLKDFGDRFSKITKEHKKEWIENIETQLRGMLEENDIFFNQVPKEVIEK